MARRSDHSREEIKELALDAAKKIVAEHGFAALSARKIASAIGYTVGTLYLVFKNLDDLIMQLNARTLEELFKHVHQQTEDKGSRKTNSKDKHKKLRSYGQAYYHFAKQNPHLWSLIFEHHITNGEPLIPELEERIGTLFALIEAELKTLAPNKKPAAIHSAAMSLWSGVHGITILAISDKLFMAQNVTPEDMINQLIDNFLNGLLKHNPTGV